MADDLTNVKDVKDIKNINWDQLHPLMGGQMERPTMDAKGDTRESIASDVAPWIHKVRMLGTYVLVRVYVPSGGLGVKGLDGRELIGTDKRTGEANYQGKVGLILDMGPIAFVEDARHQWGDRKPAVHDWVLFNVGDGKALEIGSRSTERNRYRIFDDVNLHAIVDDPDLVY